LPQLLPVEDGMTGTLAADTDSTAAVLYLVACDYLSYISFIKFLDLALLSRVGKIAGKNF